MKKQFDFRSFLLEDEDEQPTGKQMSRSSIKLWKNGERPGDYEEMHQDEDEDELDVEEYPESEDEDEGDEGSEDSSNEHGGEEEDDDGKDANQRWNEDQFEADNGDHDF